MCVCVCVCVCDQFHVESIHHTLTRRIKKKKKNGGRKMTIISTDIDVFTEVRTIKTIINHHIDYNGFKARETKHTRTDLTD